MALLAAGFLTIPDPEIEIPPEMNLGGIFVG
jgi:hypothetical protein